MAQFSKAFRYISLGTVNLKSVRTADGYLNGLLASNGTSEVKFLKLYDKATAPVVAEDVPIAVIAVPPNGTYAHNFGSPLSFSRGLALAITKKGEDTNNEAIAANDVSVTLLLDR